MSETATTEQPPQVEREYHPGALHKAIRDNILKVKAQSLKVPRFVADETGGDDHKYELVYVTEGVEKTEACTPAVWKKAMGPKAQPGRPVPGLDNQIYEDFFIIKDTLTKQIIGIDRLPKNDYKGGLVPEDLQGVTAMQLKVDNKTGELHVIVLPAKMRDARIRTILDSLDGEYQIFPGQMLKDCEVTTVAGNNVTIEIPPATE